MVTGVFKVGFFLDLICANPELVPKYYAPRPASPVHRLRRWTAFGRAGCKIRNKIIQQQKDYIGEIPGSML